MSHILFNQHSLQTDNVEQGESQPQFMSLVQNLLRDPNERSNFFQVQFCRIIEFISTLANFTKFIYSIDSTKYTNVKNAHFCCRLTDQVFGLDCRKCATHCRNVQNSVTSIRWNWK